MDGIQVYGAHGFVFENSRISNVNAGHDVGQGLFMQEANGGTFSDVTIQNSMFGSTPNNNVSLSGPGNGTWSGYVHIYYNTIQGNLRLYGNPGSQIFAPGTSIIVAGNIVERLASSYNNSCTVLRSDGAPYTPTYSHNLAANQKCGATDIRGSAKFVNPGPLSPDLHLAAGSPGLGRGALDLHPPKDSMGECVPSAGRRTSVPANRRLHSWRRALGSAPRVSGWKRPLLLRFTALPVSHRAPRLDLDIANVSACTEGGSTSATTTPDGSYGLRRRVSTTRPPMALGLGPLSTTAGSGSCRARRRCRWPDSGGRPSRCRCVATKDCARICSCRFGCGLWGVLARDEASLSVRGLSRDGPEILLEFRDQRRPQR